MNSSTAFPLNSQLQSRSSAFAFTPPHNASINTTNTQPHTIRQSQSFSAASTSYSFHSNFSTPPSLASPTHQTIDSRRSLQQQQHNYNQQVYSTVSSPTHRQNSAAASALTPHAQPSPFLLSHPSTAQLIEDPLNRLHAATVNQAHASHHDLHLTLTQQPQHQQQSQSQQQSVSLSAATSGCTTPRDGSLSLIDPTYKTELCRSFSDTAYCRYGAKCRFAHGLSDLRAATRHKKYKTEACKNYQRDGACPYGARCRFIHNTITHDQDVLPGLGPIEPNAIPLGLALTASDPPLHPDSAASTSPFIAALQQSPLLKSLQQQHNNNLANVQQLHLQEQEQLHKTHINNQQYAHSLFTARTPPIHATKSTAFSFSLPHAKLNSAQAAHAAVTQQSLRARSMSATTSRSYNGIMLNNNFTASAANFIELGEEAPPSYEESIESDTRHSLQLHSQATVDVSESSHSNAAATSLNGARLSESVMSVGGLDSARLSSSEFSEVRQLDSSSSCQLQSRASQINDIHAFNEAQTSQPSISSPHSSQSQFDTFDIQQKQQQRQQQLQLLQQQQRRQQQQRSVVGSVAIAGQKTPLQRPSEPSSPHHQQSSHGMPLTLESSSPIFASSRNNIWSSEAEKASQSSNNSLPPTHLFNKRLQSSPYFNSTGARSSNPLQRLPATQPFGLSTAATQSTTTFRQQTIATSFELPRAQTTLLQHNSIRKSSGLTANAPTSNPLRTSSSLSILDPNDAIYDSQYPSSHSSPNSLLPSSGTCSPKVSAIAAKRPVTQANETTPTITSIFSSPTITGLTPSSEVLLGREAHDGQQFADKCKLFDPQFKLSSSAAPPSRSFSPSSHSIVSTATASPSGVDSPLALSSPRLSSLSRHLSSIHEELENNNNDQNQTMQQEARSLLVESVLSSGMKQNAIEENVHTHSASHQCQSEQQQLTTSLQSD